MLAFEDFFNQARDSRLGPYCETLNSALQSGFYQHLNGDLPDWLDTYKALPELVPDKIVFDAEAITFGSAEQVSDQQRQQLVDSLQLLHPWRKGPFNLFGVHIDTEWRSYLKWQRVEPHVRPLGGKYVLDIGCGNGYYMWRMMNQQPRLVLGIDPSQKYLMQFRFVKKYAPQVPLHYLPLRSEDLPNDMAQFDTVFSMGVLYHRRSPFDHLEELGNCLVSGGQLILETLVIDGEINEVLVPTGRYAQMRNVWFLPSCATLKAWLERTGFINVRIVDVGRTRVEEQRATEWMRFQSLANYLHPDDPDLTVEGHPAPQRAVVIADKP